MFSFEIEGEDGSRGVYLMVTLRLLFHIGSVECVTCHVSLSHSMVGFLWSGDAGAVEKVGGRRAIDAMLILNNLPLPVVVCVCLSHLAALEKENQCSFRGS